MKYFVTLDGKKEYEIDIEEFGKKFKTKIENKAYTIEILWTRDDVSFVALVNNRSYVVAAKLVNNKLEGLFLNRPFSFLVEDVDDNLMRKIAAKSIKALPETVVKSPFNGVVTRVAANQGVKIRKDDPVLIIESMKMENVFAAPADGIVANIMVKQGETVTKDQVLFSIDTKGSSSK